MPSAERSSSRGSAASSRSRSRSRGSSSGSRDVSRSPPRKRLASPDGEKPSSEREQQQKSSPVRRVSEDPAAAAAMTLMSRTGGAYIPPARLRAMQAKIQDKSSEAFQRMSWEALKKSINGLINKANTSNIKNIIPELISENLVRGSGLFCRSIMKSQSAALPFTPVYTALIAVLNTKFPQLGELICTRLILQFRKAYRRNDKLACLASTKFLAHLVNFRVAHEMIAFDILIILLEKPTDDSVEVAVGMMKECGAYLTEVQPRAVNAVFEIFRRVLHEGALDLRTQYMIEVLFQVRKDKFKDNPAVPEELDLVDEDDMVTHKLKLDDTDLDPQDTLNIFHYDPEFLENEEKYSRIKHEILGSSDDEDSGSDASSDGDDDDGKGEVDGANQATGQAADAVRKLDIMDKTDQDVIALRRKIYLTIMSSLDFQECVHKLMRLEMAPGQEIELCNMIIECCSQERTYMRFYGMMAERFAKLNRLWMELFSETFKATYATIHRYETNRLRNVSKLFAHMLATDGLPWQVMECVRLTEESTTSSSRIFLKILFQEMNEQMGIDKLSSRLKDPYMRAWFDGLFPKDSPKNTRFAINYWTSIGLGAVTEELREWLKNAPKLLIAQQQQQQQRDDASSSSSGSDSDSDSDSGSSDSDGSRSSASSRSSAHSRSRRGRDRRSPPPPASAARTAAVVPQGDWNPDANAFVHPARRGLVPQAPPPPQRSPPRRAASNGRSDERHRRRDRSYSRSPSRSPPRNGTRGGKRRSPSRSRSRSPPRGRHHARAPSRSPRRRRSPTPSRSRSRSRSPQPRRRQRRTPSSSRSRSPPPTSRPRQRSRSRSPPSTKSRQRSRTPVQSRRRHDSSDSDSDRRQHKRRR